MTTNDEIHNALMGIQSRLGVIEGKVNLIARAERDNILEDLETVVGDKPLIAQIYLAVDGVRSQRQVWQLLNDQGVEVSEATVSRTTKHMILELGIVTYVEASGKVLRKDPSADQVLNLTSKMTKWLESLSVVVPVTGKPKRRGRSK